MKSITGSADVKGGTGFPWFGMPERAETSRWWAAAGLVIMSCVIFLCYLTANEIVAAFNVTVFDPTQLFVVDGRSLDERIPYLPWTVLIYHPFTSWS